jgi:hypothetical protein
MPPWPTSLRSVARFRRLAQEQRLSAARGRSLEIVPDADATGLWQRHSAHLARRAAAPEPHDTLADYIRLAERALEHEQRSADRARPATVTALVLLVVLFVAIVPQLVPATRSAWGLLAVLLAGAVLAWVAERPLAAWVRYVRWIRPRFR